MRVADQIALLAASWRNEPLPGGGASIFAEGADVISIRPEEGRTGRPGRAAQSPAATTADSGVGPEGGTPGRKFDDAPESPRLAAAIQPDVPDGERDLLRQRPSPHQRCDAASSLDGERLRR